MKRLYKITISGVPTKFVKNFESDIKRQFGGVIQTLSIAADIITIIVGTKEIAEAIRDYILKQKKKPKLRTVSVTLTSTFKVTDVVKIEKK